MVNNNTPTGGYYPPVGFHFLVQFDDFPGANEMRFQSVGGLSAEIEMETFKEGGTNMFVYQLPVRVKFSDITLKRGLLVGSQALSWILESLNEFSFSTTSLTIMLLDEASVPLMTWKLSGVLPKKWSISELNAEVSGIVIEELVLVAREFAIAT